MPLIIIVDISANDRYCQQELMELWSNVQVFGGPYIFSDKV